jgi:hypothetical protein
MMSPLLGWIRTATAWSFPWKLVVRTPLLSKVVSRLPLPLRRATPNTQVLPAEFVPAITI